MNDGTAIPRTTLCLLLLLLIPAVPAFSQMEPLDLDEVPAYAAWRDNVRSLGNLRLTYAIESKLGSRFLWHYRHTGFPEGVSPENWPPVVHKVLHVSRAGGFVHRDLALERFEVVAVKPAKASVESVTGGDSASRLESVEIHGDGVFYSYDAKGHIGSIWPKWDRRRRYPVSFVLPPDPDEYKLVSMDITGNVLDFVTERHLMRCFLSPEAGMMPVRIESYSISNSGKQTAASLFLQGLITVAEYTKTQTGAFLPREATFYHGVMNRKDGAMDVCTVESFRLTDCEEVEEFPPNEFHYAFPPGTWVRDKIKETEYTVGAEEPAAE